MKRFMQLLRYFDWLSCLITFILCFIGLFFIFSATYSPIAPYSLFFKKQALGIMGGIVIYVIVACSKSKSLLYWGNLLYFAVMGLLLFTLCKGSVGMGAQRWVNLFFIKIQPSELAKALFPAYIASLISRQKNYHFSFYTMIPLLIVQIISFVLILKQPDLGTALVFLFTASLLVWIAGMPLKYFLYGTLLICFTMPLIWHYILKDYQKNRIMVFLGQGKAHKERYQIEQAHIAIGSGGVAGKGFLKGTQNKLRFLPEGRTDFIFAVLCEEWGFIGSIVVLMLYLILFIRILCQIKYISTLNTHVLAIGILANVVLSTIINIGMVIGLLPVVGVPLPLMSYGLSNLWVTLASFAWIQSIVMSERTISTYHTRSSCIRQ